MINAKVTLSGLEMFTAHSVGGAIQMHAHARNHTILNEREEHIVFRFDFSFCCFLLLQARVFGVRNWFKLHARHIVPL